MAERFTKIDDTNREAHTHLRPEDACFFLREYTSGRNYSFSETNSLISNLKKKPSTRRTNAAAYRWKIEAMRTCSALMRGCINAEWLQKGTLIPTPPSKAKDHPEYDERMATICRGAGAGQPFKIDVREVVIQSTSVDAAHEAEDGHRPTIEDLLAIWQIDESVAAPTPQSIAIVDDVLTAGTHFRAMKTILERRYPGVPIVGLFIARRVLPPERTAVSLAGFNIEL